MNERDPIDLLLVEDNVGYAETIRLTLEASKYFDYAITHVETLAEARRELASRSFDIIILDLVLPNGGGTDMVREVRQLVPKDTYLVIVTNYSDEAREVATRRAMADDYLYKMDFPPKQFRERIRNWAIRCTGHKKAKPGMKGMNEIGEKIEEAVKLCESSDSLPPYPKEE